MALLRLALVALLAQAACYSPKISECTISCGGGGACPFGLECLGDGYCHADTTPHCVAGGGFDASLAADARGDASMMSTDARATDARVTDGPLTMVDAGPTPDGSTGPDARRPDASMSDASTPDAGTTGCTNFVGFVEQTAEEDGIVANLTLGADGQAHVTYVDDTKDVLRYARGAPRAGSWQFETVGPAADYLKGQAIDGQGGLHLVYTERLPTPRLSYAYRPAGAGQPWALDVIDDTALSIDGSVVVDGAGAVHVAYWYNLTDLAYAVQFSRGGQWYGAPVATDGVVGEHAAIGIDSDGVVQVTYRIAGTRNDLGYAYLDPALPLWQATGLDVDQNVGAYTALAVDRADNVHAVYSDLANETLRYAFLPVNGSNRFTTAESKKFVGRFNAIATDASGGVHVSTFDYGARDLRYGFRAANASAFSFRTVDAEGDVGRHGSIAVDSSGAAHIVYADDTRGDLKYAIVCP